VDPAPLPDLLMLGASSTMVPNFSFAATPRRLTSPSPVARSAIVVARIPPGCRLNLYTRCAKCPAGRRVGGNYHHPEASFSRPGRPAKNPTYGTNRCHLDTNKSWWAPDWFAYVHSGKRINRARGGKNLIELAYHLLVRNADRFNGRLRHSAVAEDRTLFRERRLSRGARWRRASGL
jgi:hypothetical protein